MFTAVPSIFALHRAALRGGLRGALKTTPTGRPRDAAQCGERAKSPKQQNIMNTQETNTAAPSVTIASRSPAKGVLLFVVTLTDRKVVRSYSCRTMEKAAQLATRFVACVTRSAR